MRKHEKRILLMTPPFYRLFKDTYALVKYPLSLGCLAAALKSGTDWEVTAYNADFAPAAEPFDVLYLTGKGFQDYLAALADPSAGIWREVKSVIAAYAPSVVGISCTSPTFASAMVTASLVRETDPAITVVAGGPHPTAAWRQVLENPHIDLCATGEGERTVVDLVKALERGIDPATVKGICCRDKGRITATPARPAITDLDSLGYPHDPARCSSRIQMLSAVGFQVRYGYQGMSEPMFFLRLPRNLGTRGSVPFARKRRRGDRGPAEDGAKLHPFR